MEVLLTLDGQLTSPSPGDTYALRWETDWQGRQTWALYKNGRRLTKPWKLEGTWESVQDPHGGNANTE